MTVTSNLTSFNTVWIILFKVIISPSFIPVNSFSATRSCKNCDPKGINGHCVCFAGQATCGIAITHSILKWTPNISIHSRVYRLQTGSKTLPDVLPESMEPQLKSRNLLVFQFKKRWSLWWKRYWIKMLNFGTLHSQIMLFILNVGKEMNKK